MAARLYRTLAKLGRRIPEDVMVVGFGDLHFASLMIPSLTTIKVPAVDVAGAAFARLTARADDPSLSPFEISLFAPLVERESTCRNQCVITSKKGTIR